MADCEAAVFEAANGLLLNLQLIGVSACHGYKNHSEKAIERNFLDPAVLADPLDRSEDYRQTQLICFCLGLLAWQIGPLFSNGG